MSHNALPIGTLLNQNLLVSRVLGQGGFGITYLVHDNFLQQDFVLKEFFPMQLAQRIGQEVIPQEQADAQASFSHYLRRFLEEARLAAKIDHPNLVKVHHFFTANGTGYFAMPWQQGETLEQLLKREIRLAPQAAVDLIYPLLDGLEKLHAAGLVHRDVKPANIYLRSEGGPLLIDFGTARAPAATTGPLTTILSPGYAPLEQYTEDRVQGPHTDVYAVGAVLYVMVTGEKPLDALTRCTSDGNSRKYVPCRDAAPASVPLALRDVIDKAMMLHVEGRIPDAPSLRLALHAALKSKAKPVGLLHFSTIGLLVAMLVVGGWFVSHRNVSPSVEPVPGTAQPAKAARMSDAPFIATKPAPPAVLETPEAIPPPAIQTASQQPRNIEKISKSVPSVANQAAAQQAIALLGTLKTYERVAALKTIPLPDQISGATASDLLEGTGNQRTNAIALIAPQLTSNMVGSELALVLGETQTNSRVESIRSIERAGKISNNLSANEAILVLDGTGNQRANAIALIAPQLTSNMAGSELALVLGETQTYSRVESIKSIERAGKIKRGLTAEDVALVSAGLRNQTASGLGVLAPYLAR